MMLWASCHAGPILFVYHDGFSIYDFSLAVWSQVTDAVRNLRAHLCREPFLENIEAAVVSIQLSSLIMRLL